MDVGGCNVTGSLREESTEERKRIVATSSGRFKLTDSGELMEVEGEDICSRCPILDDSVILFREIQPTRHPLCTITISRMLDRTSAIADTDTTDSADRGLFHLVHV